MKSCFVLPLGAVLFGGGTPDVDADMDGDAAFVAEMPRTQMAKEVCALLALLANVNLKFQTKLRRAAPARPPLVELVERCRA